MLDKVPLGEVYLPVPWFYPLTLIPQLLQTNLHPNTRKTPFIRTSGQSLEICRQHYVLLEFAGHFDRKVFLHCFWYSNIIAKNVGRDSSVGIATDYGLESPGIESLWKMGFSAPVQTGPGTQSASCTMGTRSLPGVKIGRGVTLTPKPLLVPLVMKE
jgi:hypothetical protein